MTCSANHLNRTWTCPWCGSVNEDCLHDLCHNCDRSEHDAAWTWLLDEARGEADDWREWALYYAGNSGEGPSRGDPETVLPWEQP